VKPDSQAVHAGRELGSRSPLGPPLTQTSAYVFDDLDDYDAVAEGRAAEETASRSPMSTWRTL